MDEDEEDLREEIMTLKQEVTARNDEIALLNQEVTLLKHEIAVRNDEISLLNREVDTLKAEVTALKHDFTVWIQVYEYYQDVLSLSHKVVATCYESLSTLPPPPPIPKID